MGSWSYANLQDGSSFGIFAQRFEKPTAILDVDGNGSFSALTDALMILRFAFGFTGNALIGNAVYTGGCTRCTAPAIEAYLSGLV